MRANIKHLLFIEPFYGGSHQQWVDGYKQFSSHNITIYSLPDRFWKWRMQGAAITFSSLLNQSKESFDLIVASDMLNVPLFKSLLIKEKRTIPIVCYFHENQLTYTWSPTDQDVKLNRDQHYAFINYASALASDQVLFNSDYHKTSFLNALSDFLKQFPDFNNEDTVELIKRKCDTLHIGLNLSKLMDSPKSNNEVPVILWNHRWEYDKNPKEFFQVLYNLSASNVRFQLIVLGEKSEKYPLVFDEAKEKLKKHIIHWGYADSKSDYYSLLLKSDVLPVTSHQDFFGMAVVEAVASGVYPLLPKRLAFPEILDCSKYPHHFYDEEKLETSLRNNINKIASHELRRSVARFDWSQMVNKYDEIFERLG